MAQEDSALQASPIIRNLASSDPKTRETSLTHLRMYLTSRAQPFTTLDNLKLWKGLFYCMWMCDGPHNQQQLASDLSALLNTSLSDANVIPFLSAFWQTMAREWTGIPVLRMNKYLYLVRQMLAATFRYVRRKNWDRAVVREVNEIHEATAFEKTDRKIPDGIRYHMLDIFVDELDIVVEGDDKGERREKRRKAAVEELFEPARSLNKGCVTKAVRKRAGEMMEDAKERLGVVWEGKSRKDKKNETVAQEDDWDGFDD